MLRYLLAGVSAAAFSSVALAAAPLAEDAKAFGTREAVQSMSISPSGAAVAMLASGPGSHSVLGVVDLTTGEIAKLTSSDGKPQSLYWCNFAGNTKLVCLYGGIEPYQNYLIHFSQLIKIDTDGSDMKPLGQKASSRDAYIRQNAGDIIDWLPGVDGSVLMARSYVPDGNSTGTLVSRAKEGLGVDRIDLRSLKSRSVEPARRDADSYMTDGRGNVRVLIASQADSNSGQLTGAVKVRYRAAGSRDWLELGDYNSVSNEGFYPLAVDAGTDSLYALRKTNGRDALYRVKLDGSRSSTLVGADQAVDIDGVVRLGEGQRVIGYTYADERRRTVYFDPELAKLQQSLARALPSQPLISFHGASSDGQKLLVFASGDTHPGTFYRFDRASKQLAEIAQVRPDLKGKALAPVKAIRVTATDGASIPAYLTIPAGSDGKNLPAVVLPHGGPSARDEWGFDWLAQFLAARGYAVIQPNYRGSAGYGEAWLVQNGFRSWRTSIGDVTASARYLVSQGIADPNKLAILGWSYGGYAALQSAAVEPGLYKAAVAIAPVTDLSMLRRDAEGFTNARLVKNFVGSGPHLSEGSPADNVAAIRAPVLLVHGDRDANVAIEQSERMVRAMKSSGKQVEMIRFKGLDHQLNDSDARVQMLTRIGQFLESSIGH